MSVDIEALRAEVRAELLTEFAAKKREASAWKKARVNIEKDMIARFGLWEAQRILDAGVMIARMVLKRKITVNFTDEDVRMACDMLEEMLNVAVKYKEKLV